jgi:hypothetical protein
MNEEDNKMQNAAPWPMSNEELQQWFARPNIPIEELTQMWLSMDQNPNTKSEIAQLRSNNKMHELEKKLRNRIQFGTAGILSSLQLLANKRSSRTNGSGLLPHEQFNCDPSVAGPSRLGAPPYFRV